MHPYRIQQLIRERGKDEVVNVRQRASVYQAIDRLERDKLIDVAGTERDENWPERTVYQLTSTGRRAVVSWLREMLAAPAPGYPEFPAALAFLPLLEPADARRPARGAAHLDPRRAPRHRSPRRRRHPGQRPARPGHAWPQRPRRRHPAALNQDHRCPIATA
jgi:Transcriptional regulator PadR-like family